MKRIVAAVGLSLAVLTAPGAASATPSFPASLPLPAGSYPEGIAVGRGHDFYVGSLLGGAIYKGDLRTGQGQVLASSAPGRVVVGLSFDQRSGLLWGVGFDGSGSGAFVFDGRSGDLVAEVPIAAAFPGAFLNDLVVTRDAVYITDSLGTAIWSVPLNGRGLPIGPAEAIPLSGDFKLVRGTNLNGIDVTANGRYLIAVHSALGVLYRIDPSTGIASEIDLGGDAVPSGDGVELRGRTLYVVQNFLNQVSVVSLAGDLLTGEITDRITSDSFRVPSTAAVHGNSLYVVNARFDAALPPFLGGQPTVLNYDVVRVRR